MPRRKPSVYLFNWPSGLGGADTKAEHLLRLLKDDFEWTVVPNAADRMHGAEGRKAVRWLKSLGVRAAAWEELPGRLEGTGLCLCNTWWLSEGRAVEAKQRGLRLVWGNEMMWHHTAELGAVSAGLLDVVTYVSPVQRARLEAGYAAAVGVTDFNRGEHKERRGEEGAEIGGTGRIGGLRWAMVGNYVEPEAFPFVDRSRRWGRKVSAAAKGKAGSGPCILPASNFSLSVGRLSRPDPDKFPSNFPQSYESLGLGRKGGEVKFRVMAWSEELAARFAGHEFDERWELLPARKEPAARFLGSLDLFVYELGGRFGETWGRSTVEAMLTGAVPLISGGKEGLRHHLRHLVPDGVGGFHCTGRRDFSAKARLLEADVALRLKVSRAAAEYAREVLCDARKHRAVWREVLAQCRWR